MRRKDQKIKYIILSIVLVIGILIAFSVRFTKEERNLNFLEKAVKDSIVFVGKICNAPIDFINDKINEHNETKNLYKKYTALKEKVEKTDLYYAEIKELQSEIDSLKKTLDLNNTLSEYTYKNATVISRNVGYWYNNITIDKGSKNGIKIGDAVIVSSGLVGKVVSVANFSSTVKLLTSDEITNKISVKIITQENEHLHGLLIGYREDNNTYKIEGITDASKIHKGDIVMTTGLTDYFPSGILLGKVKKIVNDEYDLTSIVEVTPSVDFTSLDVVTVLRREASK